MLAQLRQLGQPRERPGWVEDHRGDAPPGRLVGQQPEQHALAGAEATHDRHQPRRLPDLGRVVGVEHDRPPRRAHRVADVGPTPVTQPARSRGDTGRDVQRGQPPAVRRCGDRLARDELAQQAVLPSRVLDADPAGPERGRHVPRPLQALLLRASGNRQPEPAMDPGGGDLHATGHLVLDHAGLGRLASQGQRLVEVVLGVVTLHVAYDEQLALDGPPGFPARQDIQLARPLDREREPVGVRQPRLPSRVGGLELLEPADRHHRHVPLHRVVQAATGQLDGAAQRGAGVLHRVGEAVQVLGSPFALLRRTQSRRRRETDAHGPSYEPLHLARGRRSALEPGQRDRLGDLLDLGQQSRVLDVARVPPDRRDQPVGVGTVREAYAEVDLLVGHRLVPKVLLQPDHVLRPVVDLGGLQRVRGQLVQPLGPLGRGIGPRRHAQVETVTGQPRQTVGDTEHQLLPLAVRTERPRLRRQDEPGPRLVGGEAEVVVDVAQAQWCLGCLVSPRMSEHGSPSVEARMHRCAPSFRQPAHAAP